MQIISNESLLLDEVFNDLKRKKVKSTKNFKEIDGGMGDVTSYLDLALNLAPVYAGTLITYLTYRLTQKKNYLHFKYKDGVEVKFDNLSKDELKKKELQIREDIANNKLEFIYIG
jgi:hypothetical protein